MRDFHCESCFRMSNTCSWFFPDAFLDAFFANSCFLQLEPALATLLSEVTFRFNANDRCVWHDSIAATPIFRPPNSFVLIKFECQRHSI